MNCLAFAASELQPRFQLQDEVLRNSQHGQQIGLLQRSKIVAIIYYAGKLGDAICECCAIV